ncbi:hypothetical protein HK104_002943, partial [Borealophlyctis nickersoniae]
MWALYNSYHNKYLRNLREQPWVYTTPDTGSKRRDIAPENREHDAVEAPPAIHPSSTPVVVVPAEALRPAKKKPGRKTKKGRKLSVEGVSVP